MARRISRALLRRCPRCGSGGIFAGWWALRDRCPRCDLVYEREEGYWLGAIAINTGAAIVAFGVVFVGSIVATWPSPPWGVVSAAVIATTLIVPIVFYPISKTIWVAIDLTLGGS
jgi:uncharacterized protein (DUF983 family)